MNIKVLLIEDDKDDFYIIKHYLSQISTANYEVEWCCDFDLAEEEILEEKHDIYLIDYYLGKGKGIDIIERLKKQSFLKPIILLTGADDKKVESKAISIGAADFLVKSNLKADTLERSIRYAIDRHEKQQSIREQEKKYRSLFELSLEPFLVLDEDFNILEYNPVFLEVFHMLSSDDERIKNMSFKGLFKNQEDFDKITEKLSVNGFVKGYKTTLLNQDTEIVAGVSIASLPENRMDGKSIYQVAINDLTKIMEQESELKKAEKLSMSGRMARMIAHEIRNPLTNIRLALGELSSMAIDNDDIQLMTQMIERNSYRISDLIDVLLKSARPQELTKEKCDLRDVVKEAIAFCQDRMKLLNVNLRTDICDNEIIGEWDREKMEIALSNIIINAIEAMEDTENPVLHIKVACEDGAVIYIKDNGRGMEKETLANLFDPFFSNRKNGLGLGMTATLNIINMHDGKIDVQSKVGEGTEFRVQV